MGVLRAAGLLPEPVYEPAHSAAVRYLSGYRLHQVRHWYGHAETGQVDSEPDGLILFPD